MNRKIGGPSFTRMKKTLGTYCLISYDIKGNPKYRKYFESVKTVINIDISPQELGRKKIEEHNEKMELGEKTSPTGVKMEKRIMQPYNFKIKEKEDEFVNLGVDIFNKNTKSKDDENPKLLNKIKNNFDFSFSPRKIIKKEVKPITNDFAIKNDRMVSIVKKNTPKLKKTPFLARKSIFQKKNEIFSKYSSNELKAKNSGIDNNKLKVLEEERRENDKTPLNIFFEEQGYIKKEKKNKKKFDALKDLKRMNLKKDGKNIMKVIEKTLKLHKKGKVELTKADIKELEKMKFMIELEGG